MYMPYTVESRYLELGYIESRAVSNWMSFPLKGMGNKIF